MSMVMEQSSAFQACISACSKWAQACYECFSVCLDKPDLEARKR